MTKTEEDLIKELNIHERIHEIMRSLSYIQKEDKKVNNMYTFVSHDAVTMAVQPLLVLWRVMIEPSVSSHTQDGNRTEVNIDIAFVNIDRPEDRFVVSFFGYGVDSQDKGPGKAFSYAKKYAFLQVFCLGTGDDPEKDNVDYKPEEVKRPTGKSRSAMNDEGHAIQKEMREHDNLKSYIGCKRFKTFVSDCEKFGDDDTLEAVRNEYARLMKKPETTQQEIDERVDWFIKEIQEEKNAKTCATILQTAQKFLKDNGVQHGSTYHKELTQVHIDHCKHLAAS
ncbi:MAG: ERF family protein [Nitrosomonadaceae bacterium]